MAYFIIDPDQKKLLLANAGHLPLICYSGAKKTLVELIHDGYPLGIIDCIYGEMEFVLASGDLVLAYTDGVTECKNLKGELFGLSALKKAIAGCAGKSIVQNLSMTLAAFRGNSPISDDVTMVSVKLK